MNTQRELAHQSARILREAGHVVYLAGGAVRDQLLEKEPKDYDLATSARPEEVQALFKKSDTVGAHFGVIIVKGDGEMIEVATFRTDGSYQDGRRLSASCVPSALPPQVASKSKRRLGQPFKNAPPCFPKFPPSGFAMSSPASCWQMTVPVGWISLSIQV